MKLNVKMRVHSLIQHPVLLFSCIRLLHSMGENINQPYLGHLSTTNIDSEIIEYLNLAKVAILEKASFWTNV